MVYWYKTTKYFYDAGVKQRDPCHGEAEEGVESPLDIRGLKYFISAAECLNFTRAAKECYITQTAMSLHIAKMEEELGFQLFNRNNRTVELTVAGRDFYHRARLVVKTYEEAVHHSRNTASGKAGSVNLCVPSCIDGLVIMPRLKRFCSSFSHINLDVRLLSPRYMMESLKRGETDAALCWMEDLEQDPDLEVIQIGTFPLWVAAGVNHHFAKMEKVPLSLLREENGVTIELKGAPSGYRPMHNGWVQAGFEPKSITKVDKMEEVLFLVELEDAVAMVPNYVAHNATGKLVFRPLEVSDGEELTTTLAVERLKSNGNPALNSMVSVLTDKNIAL